MKKNSFYIKSVVGFIILLFTACNINREPYDKFVTNIIEDDPDYVKNATLGLYAYIKGSGLSASWINNAHRVMEYTGDNIALSGTTTDDLYYMYNYQRIETGWRNNDFWVRSYRAIYAANLLINNTKENQNKEYDHCLGEAYFIRAMMHFYLVNVYGRPYSQGGDKLGVPIKITSDVNDLPARSTIAEVYTQVIKDLEKAEQLMGDVNKEVIYANKDAVYALLSRVYLYMGTEDGNNKAVTFAQKLIDNPKYKLLDPEAFRTMNTLVPEKNPEAIFSIRYITDLDEGDQSNSVGGFYAYLDGYGWGEMYASRTYLDLVNYFPNDSRKAFISPLYEKDKQGNITSEKEGLWVRPITTVDKATIPTYRSGQYLKNNGKDQLKEILKINTNGDKKDTVFRIIQLQHRITPTNVTEYYFNEGGQDTIVHLDYTMQKRNEYPKYFIVKCSKQDNSIHSWSPSILRLAEVYLNKAEALAKIGKNTEAISTLNELRQQRGIPPYVAGDIVSGRGKTDLLEIILDERRLELAYEGHRAFDVFRNKRTLNRNYPGTHALNKNHFLEIKYDENMIIQLIPLTQMNAQDNLIQNPT